MVFAYCTTKDRAEAERIGRELVTKKLVACVNIIDGMTSLYWWEGKIEEGREAILIAKTEDSLVDKMIAEVKRLHSYSVPCVVTLPIQKGNPDYLDWLKESLR